MDPVEASWSEVDKELKVIWSQVGGRVTDYAIQVQQCTPGDISDDISGDIVDDDTWLRLARCMTILKDVMVTAPNVQGGARVEYVTREVLMPECTAYRIQVSARNGSSNVVQGLTSLMTGCQDDFTEILLAVILVLIGVFFAVSLCAFIYFYHKKEPIQRIQRVRSKVYSR